MVGDDDRDTKPATPRALLVDDVDPQERETWPPESLGPRDPREDELERAGVVFTRQEGRDVLQRLLREEKQDGFDAHHQACKALVEDVRNELLHEMRSQAQRFELRLAALELEKRKETP